MRCRRCCTRDTVQAYVTLQPITQLTIDNTYLLDRTSDAHTAMHAYESQTFRTKLNYQFTRSLSARAHRGVRLGRAQPAGQLA